MKNLQRVYGICVFVHGYRFRLARLGEEGSGREARNCIEERLTGRIVHYHMVFLNCMHAYEGYHCAVQLMDQLS